MTLFQRPELKSLQSLRILWTENMSDLDKLVDDSLLSILRNLPALQSLVYVSHGTRPRKFGPGV
ncbi:hypothetical protein M011DRAFT_472666 [Sporormia fimetaria CBS 119925]|uniref:Uncharacterized protein n=1 Tax=Sporormia fimetaria CBS 119925 TaxID=1340428 RepID=A0A6A6UWR3_9PLEO|nr:hypothetical protein M011DRAFT_472666 [Sporormia fimetaria CBS 119925]